jgi:hypothetical protein
MKVRWLELPGGEIGLVPIENLNDNQLLVQTNTPYYWLCFDLHPNRLQRHIFKETRCRSGH